MWRYFPVWECSVCKINRKIGLKTKQQNRNINKSTKLKLKSAAVSMDPESSREGFPFVQLVCILVNIKKNIYMVIIGFTFFMYEII